MPPNPIDFEKILRAYQNTWAHALALQEIIEEQLEPESSYPALKEKYDRLAAEKFEMFYKALNDPEGFAKAARDFLEMQTKSSQVH